MSHWHGKTALVTGASQGLGVHVARAFLRAGANVVICAREEQTLESTAETLRATAIADSGALLAVSADVTDDRAVESLVETSTEQFGRLDVLVNNAGRSARGRLADTSPEAVRDLMEINLLGTIRCTLKALPHLLDSRGSVVNIGSLAGKAAARYMGGYPVTKFAVTAYSQQLRLELGPQGLHVLLVCPGPIARDESSPPRNATLDTVPDNARRPGGGAKVKLLRPEVLARDILNACQARKPELVYPARARLLFALQQLSPKLGDWVLKRMT